MRALSHASHVGCAILADSVVVLIVHLNVVGHFVVCVYFYLTFCYITCGAP